MRKIIIAVIALQLAVAIGLRADLFSSDVRAPDNDEFVVHEWGTFTTFSGSDGVFLDFRPLAAEHSDLPSYVLDRGSYSDTLVLTKKRLFGRVRMETPVTYFYTDQYRKVNVRVRFPEGLLTEFYPPVQNMSPAVDDANIFGKGELIGNSQLDWGEVDLLPINQLATGSTDAVNQQRLVSAMLSRLLPHGPNEQHYAEARKTQSALLHVRGKTGKNSIEQDCFEKFLFYRGVGKFQLPISAHYESDKILLSNGLPTALTSSLLIDVNEGKIRMSKLQRAEAGTKMPFDTPSLVTNEQLARVVKERLMAAGLYADEAASMVQTWQDSWFTENGTRILYLLPAAVTDELLPLEITPAPDRTLRVMVGRMELMSPEAEQDLMTAVAQSSRDRVKHQSEQVGQKRNSSYSIPNQIRSFGRMAEPALVRVSKIAKDADIRVEANRLITEFRK